MPNYKNGKWINKKLVYSTLTGVGEILYEVTEIYNSFCNMDDFIKEAHK